MTPNSKKPYNQNPRRGERKDSTGKSPTSRIKMLLAAGAVAGTLGGWGLLSQQDTMAAVQTADSTAAALVVQLDTATPTSATQASATSLPGTSTPTAQATATTALSTATSTTEATATTAAATTTPTATTVQQAPTATPAAVTKTRSSR